MPGVNYYNPDDVKAHFKRTNKIPNPSKARKSFTPGRVVILLAGRFKGKRVVVLKRLESGLFLISGPYKANGVPLRRLNQAYAQPTSTEINVSNVNVEHITDAYFAKRSCEREVSYKTAWNSLAKEHDEEDQKNLQKKKETQNIVDKDLLEEISKTPLLRRYLSRRFSLRKNTKPHAMKF